MAKGRVRVKVKTTVKVGSHRKTKTARKTFRA